MSRLQAGLLALLLLAASCGGSAWWGYARGTAAADARHTAAGINTFVRAVARAAAAGEAIARIGQQLAQAIEHSHHTERASVHRVKEIMHAEPEFAAVRRPAELQRMRHHALERITRAADADRLQP